MKTKEKTTSLAEKKESLSKAAEQYQLEIKEDIQELQDKAATIIKTAVTAGLIGYSAYTIFRRLFSKKRESVFQEMFDGGHEHKAHKSTGNPLVNMLKEQATVLLIDVARNKIMDFLEDFQNKKKVIH